MDEQGHPRSSTSQSVHLQVFILKEAVGQTWDGERHGAGSGCSGGQESARFVCGKVSVILFVDLYADILSSLLPLGILPILSRLFSGEGKMPSFLLTSFFPSFVWEGRKPQTMTPASLTLRAFGFSATKKATQLVFSGKEQELDPKLSSGVISPLGSSCTSGSASRFPFLRASPRRDREVLRHRKGQMVLSVHVHSDYHSAPSPGRSSPKALASLGENPGTKD